VIQVVPAVFAAQVVTLILNVIHVVPSVFAALVVPLLFWDRLIVFDRLSSDRIFHLLGQDM
jgi:hypothetical protein